MKNDPHHWATLSDRLLVDEWPYLRLHEQEVLLPHGGTIPHFWVMEHPDWVTVLAVTKSEQIVLIRQYRHGVSKVCWELPAGLIDAGESPLHAAQRELLEETGFGGGEWIEWTRLNPNPSTHTNTTHCFLATGVEQMEAQKLEKNEEITVFLLQASEVQRLLAGHEIDQALHAAPLWRYLCEKMHP